MMVETAGASCLQDCTAAHPRRQQSSLSRPTELPFMQAAENVQKVQQKDLLHILNWHTIIEMGNVMTIILIY
jgi:hypothetical protein